MKIEQDFLPISITIETKAEFDYLLGAIWTGYGNALTKEQNDFLKYVHDYLSKFKKY